MDYHARVRNKTKIVFLYKYKSLSTGNPQQNSVIEQGFDTLYSCICIMLSHEEIHGNLNIGLWPECAATATKLENIMVNPHK